jgi:succinate dehydrogenase/fumarate reductase cytochrome b subunit
MKKNTVMSASISTLTFDLVTFISITHRIAEFFTLIFSGFVLAWLLMGNYFSNFDSAMFLLESLFCDSFIFRFVIFTFVCIVIYYILTELRFLSFDFGVPMTPSTMFWSAIATCTLCLLLCAGMFMVFFI